MKYPKVTEVAGKSKGMQRAGKATVCLLPESKAQPQPRPHPPLGYARTHTYTQTRKHKYQNTERIIRYHTLTHTQTLMTPMYIYVHLHTRHRHRKPIRSYTLTLQASFLGLTCFLNRTGPKVLPDECRGLFHRLPRRFWRLLCVVPHPLGCQGALGRGCLECVYGRFYSHTAVSICTNEHLLQCEHCLLLLLHTMGANVTLL